MWINFRVGKVSRMTTSKKFAWFNFCKMTGLKNFVWIYFREDREFEKYFSLKKRKTTLLSIKSLTSLQELTNMQICKCWKKIRKLTIEGGGGEKTIVQCSRVLVDKDCPNHIVHWRRFFHCLKYVKKERNNNGQN